MLILRNHFIYREVAVQHNVIVLVVNNIVVNSSAYSRNFKDSEMNRIANEPSHKPSLGKLFCEAANVRFRISYLNSNENEPKLLYRNSTVFREVSLEKDDSKIASNSQKIQLLLVFGGKSFYNSHVLKQSICIAFYL